MMFMASPAPIPRMTLPPESASTVAIMCAAWAGWVRCVSVTAEASFSFLVLTAIAERIVHGSSLSPSRSTK